MPPKRTRRSAEEARGIILDAAEAQLVRHGPDSLRLVQLAEEIGISHPAILHHFGSREGLVKAVVERSMQRLEAQIVSSLQGDLGQGADENLLAGVFRVLADEGHARMMVWLALSGALTRDPIGPGRNLKLIAATIHKLRRGRGVDADPEDTTFTVLLAAFALLGNAIAGVPLRRGAGMAAADDETGARANARFLAWFARLLRDHLEREPTSRRTRRR
jgi:AcrR family transcriptional regulator